jgi:hypothetical protein
VLDGVARYGACSVERFAKLIAKKSVFMVEVIESVSLAATVEVVPVSAFRRCSHQ